MRRSENSAIGPIGFFDSGFGGLSIWKEVNKILPNESTIYLADSKNAPYGPKGKSKITEFAIKNTEHLLGLGCKVIVVACNTATARSIRYLRSQYDVPFIGTEPAIKPAALNTKTNSVGVLATEGTLISDLFLETSQKYTQGISTIFQKGTGLVELIEQGRLDSEETRNLLNRFLMPMLEKDIDVLVLGCTHYPFLKPLLAEILPDNIEVLDSGLAVAKRLKSVLMLEGLNSASNPVQHDFYTNKSSDLMNDFMNFADIHFESKKRVF